MGRDRNEFKDVFEWAEKIEKEEGIEEYEVSREDKDWLEEVQKASSLPRDAIRRYMDVDTSWLEWYEIEWLGKRCRAVCKECGQVFYRSKADSARGVVQTHILRGCKPTSPRGKKSRGVEDEPPF